MVKIIKSFLGFEASTKPASYFLLHFNIVALTLPRITDEKESKNSAMGVEYLETLRNSHPELSDRFNSLADLYQKKLWHQLTEKLEEFLALAAFQVCRALIAFYCVRVKISMLIFRFVQCFAKLYRNLGNLGFCDVLVIVKVGFHRFGFHQLGFCFFLQQLDCVMLIGSCS